MLTTITLTILITENIFLLLLLIIWLNRHCQKCQKIKCIEKIFNRLCRNCQKDPNKKARCEL